MTTEGLRVWLEYEILNHEQLKEEYKAVGLAPWNRGYLDALMNVKKFTESHDEDKK